MDEKIKKSLADAKAAMRRTPSGKRTDSFAAPRTGESLAERISREAEEKAREALYAENYRKRLTEGEGAAESTELVAEAAPEVADLPPRVTKTEDDGAEYDTEPVPKEPCEESTLPTVCEAETAPEVIEPEPEPETGVLTAEPEAESEAETETAPRAPRADGLPAERGRTLAGFVVFPVGAGVPAEGGEIAVMPPHVSAADLGIKYPRAVYTQPLADDEYTADLATPGRYPTPVAYESTSDTDTETEGYCPPTETEEASAPTAPAVTDLGDTGEIYERTEERCHDERYRGTETAKPYYTAPTEQEYPELHEVGERPYVKDLDELNLGAAVVDREKIEENVKLVELRMRYEIAALEREHSMLGYMHTLSGARERDLIREKKRLINRRLSKLTAAKRCERAQSNVYYTVALDKTEGSARKRAKNRAELDSVLRRVESLLSEREKINSTLIELYTGTAKEGDGAKASRRYVRAARRSYKESRAVAREVRRLHAPEEQRERIIKLINDRTQARAELEMAEHNYSRARYKGSARREAKHSLAELRRRIDYISADIKHFMKRARRNDRTYRENGKQLAWIFGTVAVLGLLAGAYFLFKEQIDLFIYNLFSGGAL